MEQATKAIQQTVNTLRKNLQDTPAAKSSTITAWSTAEDVCQKCRGDGLIGWRSPASYPLHECEFCDCDEGQQSRLFWEIRATKHHQEKLATMFDSAGVPDKFRGLTVDSYIQIARDDQGKQRAISAANDIITSGQHHGKGSLFFTGQYGTGKTGLATPVLRYWLDQGKSGLWIEFYDFTDAIQSRYNSGDSVDAMEAAQGAEWVLLDDVGDLQRSGPDGFAETADKKRILYQLINHRHNHGLPTLITTNLNPRQFSDQFGRRTMERIAESFDIVEVGGRNLRVTN